jgi:hypothetical protein
MFLFASPLLVAFSVQGQFKTGLISDTTDTSLVKRVEFAGSGLNLPSSHSLQQYAPAIGEQQEGSCVSWSMAYCALTIAKNLEGALKPGQVFSARNLHSRLNAESKNPPCNDGASLLPALNLLANYGCAFSDNSDECQYTPATAEYDNRLYAFDKLSLSAQNIKAALCMNYAVVIAVSSYSDGWHVSENLISGIWNGNRGGRDWFGGHAMCIIGYNDSIGGGAFHVQNSWGSRWGADGYFWLRYEDIDIIDDAYALRYNSKGASPLVNSKTQYFRIYNNTDRNCYVSVAKKSKAQWKSMGWYAVPVGEYYDYFIGDREENEFYWIASADKNKTMWYGKTEDDREFAYDPSKPFELPEYLKSENVIRYNKAEPRASQKYYVQKLDLKQVATRGGESLLRIENESLLLDDRAAEVANKDWKSGYCLFDFYSNEMIDPYLNDQGQSVYEIWYWTRDEIRKGEFTDLELEKLKVYKFSSEETARDWKETQ